MADSNNLTSGAIPAGNLTGARDAANIILNKVYADCLPVDPDCLDLVKKLYTAHLLYIAGFALPVVSSSVGDVSTGFGNAPIQGDKEGSSPFFIEFEKLLDCPDGTGDFLTSI